MEKQVVSKKRVADHGEVLTGKCEVNAMKNPQMTQINADEKTEKIIRENLRNLRTEILKLMPLSVRP